MDTDERTRRYFNEHCPEYSPARLATACEWLREHASPVEASLLDVGCGSGSVLAHVVAATGIRDVVGMDASERPLARTAERLECPTVHASVLVPRLVERVGRQFDVVLLAAVLHHLVAGTRRGSYRLARRALQNAMTVVAPSGHLVVVEPVFAPRAPMAALFHVKRAMSTVTSRRVTLLDQWNNIGPPVVSYLTEDQLAGMVADSGNVVFFSSVEARLHPLMRVAGIRSRRDATVIARRPAA